MSDEQLENASQDVLDSRDLSIFLGNYRASPQSGCETAGVEGGGFTHIPLRYPDPETGNLRTLQLRPEIVAGQPVIAMDLKNHEVGYNERGLSTDYRTP